jgi:hypothetical protein
MDSGSLTQLSQTSAGAQMRLLEIAQILIISTLVLFAAALVIIVCLCLGDVGQPRLDSRRYRSRWARLMRFRRRLPLMLATLGSTLLRGRFSVGYGTWARRVFLRSR